MDKNKVMKIIIPLCIVVVVAGIWFAKNYNEDSKPPVTNPEGKGSSNLVVPKNEEDFALETSSIDLATLTSYELPVILDFGSESCLPCREMAPVLKTLNEKMQGKAIIKYVDVSKNGEAARDFPIQVVPTQIFINSDGTPYVPSDTIGIRFDMYSYKDTGEHALTVHQGGLTEKQMRAILADMGVAE